MYEVRVFTNEEFGNIRTMEINGEPWMVGKDVARALGYGEGKSLSNAVANHVDDEDKGVTELMTPGGIQKMVIINESGFYSLVLSSKLPGAKRFRRWVTSEVLPAIRQNGGYIHGADEMTPEELMAKALLVAQRTIENQKERLLKLEAETAIQKQVISELQPIKQYVDQILSSTGTLTTTQIAADYDLSARELNRILHEEQFQHNVSGQWVLYAEHMGHGYTASRTAQFVHSDGTPDAKMYTVWTQKGRLKIHEILTRRGIRARMDKEIEEQERNTIKIIV